MSEDLPVTTVRAKDVLILRVPQLFKSDQQKQDYLDWFCSTLTGTSLEGCKVVLLDGGSEMQVFRGDAMTT